MNATDYPFRHAGYEFPETGFPDTIEEEGIFIENLFGERDVLGDND